MKVKKSVYLFKWFFCYLKVKRDKFCKLYIDISKFFSSKLILISLFFLNMVMDYLISQIFVKQKTLTELNWKLSILISKLKINKSIKHNLFFIRR